jgi:P4 family phage/plasmid primase-like protien
VRGPAYTWQYLLDYDSAGEIAVDPSLDGLPADDLHAGWLIADECPGWLHYATTDSRWYIWNGRCHEPDTSGRIERLVLDLGSRGEVAVAALRQKIRGDAIASGASEKDIENELAEVAPAAKYLAGLRKAAGQRSLLTVLASQCGTDTSVLDESAPRVLNCANGTVSLETGLIRPHDPADLLTYCVATPWLAGAQCPMFLQLVHRMTGGTDGVTHYVLAALGYALLGENPERLIFFLNGPTSSGKSQLLYIVRSVLGSLAVESEADLITLVRHGRNARTENSIRGARLVTITETTGWMHIDEGQVKRITGEPVIAVNQHYAKTVIKTPVTWTIFIATNKMPALTDYDDAMRERVVVIPCGETIPVHQRDKRLAEKILATEREGILNLLIRSCAWYHRAGLIMPVAVQMETGRYRGQQDTVANFIAECMALCPWPADASIPKMEAWGMYQRWARGENHLRKQEFYEHMARQPGITDHDNGGSVRQYEGVRWNDRIQRMLDNTA